ASSTPTGRLASLRVIRKFHTEKGSELMGFIHIQPEPRTVSMVDVSEHREVDPFLIARGVDHGVVWQDHSTRTGVAIIVYEFGLLEGSGPYFGLGGKLYSGTPFLYRFDSRGESISFDKNSKSEPLWLPNPTAAEMAIRSGLIERPQS